MRKRLAIVTVTALTALGGVSGASAAVWNFPKGGNNGAPAGAQCAKADTTCTAPGTNHSAPLMGGAKPAATHGGGYSAGKQSSSAAAPGTGGTALGR